MHGMTTEAGVAAWVPDTTSFGSRLALVRWRMGWNAKEAALACGLPPGSWRDWEVHGRMPRNVIQVAGQVAERTGVDDLWLLTGRMPQGPRPNGPDEGPAGDACAAPDSNREPTDSGWGRPGVVVPLAPLRRGTERRAPGRRELVPAAVAA